MPSIHNTLTPSQLARDLEARDLTDPTEGGHAIQRLIDAAVTSLAAAWNCQVGLPRFDGQGWWLGQAAWWMTSSWAAVSNSSGVM